MSDRGLPEGIFLRPARLPEDFAGVAEMMGDLNDVELVWEDDRAPGAEIGESHLTALVHLLEHDGGLFQVAQQPRDGMIGFCLGVVDTRFGTFIRADLRKQYEISDLFVAEAWRGRGVGRALIDAQVDYAQSLNLPRVMIGALWRNERARQSYERAGFRMQAVEMVLEL